ncbi:MAG: OmpA family protein [Vicinamibacterales bacterium]
MLDRWMAVASPFAFAALCWLCLTDRAPSPSAAAAASASRPAASAVVVAPRLDIRWAQATHDVRLAGAVAGAATRQEIESRARVVDPAATITNHLEVSAGQTDEAWTSVALDVWHAAHTAMPAGQVVVDARSATLSGAVVDEAARRIALDVVRLATQGRLEVVDAMTVGASAAGVEADIERLLQGRTIEFETASAVITPVGRATLDELAAILRRSPDVTVEVGGHTDASGDEEHNRRLSDARAQAVRTYLVSRGVAAAALTARGYGATRPLVTGDSEAAAGRNRRIEFRVLDREKGR